MDPALKTLFDSVERYVLPLMGRDESSNLSKPENLVLALQNINRLNIYLGKIARSGNDSSGAVHLLQMQINNLTIALKNENAPFMKSSLASARTILSEIGKGVSC